MIAKAYLLIVAAIYLGLAMWCAFSPETTARKVGFELSGGTGRSEFVTVYGGLEFGIALILAFACWRDATVHYGVFACVLLHGSLVLFRTISFFRYSDIAPFTYKLAAGEWVVTLVGLFILMKNSSSK